MRPPELVAFSDLFDQRDVDRFNSSQRYVDRFFKHVDSVASSAEEQIDLAMNIVIQCFKFRKETRMAGEKPLLRPLQYGQVQLWGWR